MNKYIELIKYTKIKAIGADEIKELLTLSDLAVVEVKLDGGNARTTLNETGDGLIFGSRTNTLPYDADTNGWLFVGAMKQAFEKYPDKFVKGIQYISESMQKHTLTYTKVPLTVGYDCIDLSTGEYLPYEQSKKLFEDIGIPFVHIHCVKPANELTVDELVEYIKQPVYRDGAEEGVVVKVYSTKNRFGRPMFGKIVTDDFKVQNRKAFGENQPKKPKGLENRIAEMYFTPARFEKAIQHFKQEGELINMSLMPKLFAYISDDILIEHILEIKNMGNSLNFGSMNKIIASKSANMLKEVKS